MSTRRSSGSGSEEGQGSRLGVERRGRELGWDRQGRGEGEGEGGATTSLRGEGGGDSD